jgi:hypothetical protein
MPHSVAHIAQHVLRHSYGAYCDHVRETPKPLDPPMVPFAVTGIVLWAVLGLVLLPFHGWLSAHGHLNWLWTCVAGFLLGFVGLAVMIVHDRHRQERMRG